MAAIDDNVGRSQRLQPLTPAKAGAGKPPADPPSEKKPEATPDQRSIGARPRTDAERQQAAVEAVKQAQAGTAPKAPDEKPASKAVAEVVSVVDGVREGVRIGSSVDELRALPMVGKAVQSQSRFGTAISALARSRVGVLVADALKNHRLIAPMARGLSRIAPVAGVVIAGFDLRDAVKTSQDPKASGLEKGLAGVKGALSTVSGIAGLATLALAPTGVGAAIAGGIALGAGLLATGVDLWLGNVREKRTKAEKATQQAAQKP